MKCRNENTSQLQRVSHDSHVNICHLTKEETEERLRNVQKEKKSLMAKNQRLQQKIQKDGVTLTSDENNKILSLMNETSADATNFPQDSFQSILWNEQLKYNSLKDKRQMRWHPLLIRFALSIKYASSAAYQQVTKLGFLALPSERTLRDYTHWCPTTVESSCILLSK